ncbi:MAG: hypothetical protein H0V52_10445 [Acidimicrobiia bacterium]|jgi:hypothetical protein|nr:hypothetical protein [Acidimicrobiia bacterium]
MTMTYYDIDDVSVSIDDVARPPALPFSDDHTRALIDQAVASLISLRLPLSHDDAAAELHALASIVAEAQARLPYAATDARDQDHSWAEIATCLGVSPAAARRRFAGAATTRRSPLDPD